MTKWTTANIPPQTGRLAVITGANTGLGRETALALAEQGAHVVLAVRDLVKGQAAADQIAGRVPHATVSLQQLDLSSLASVRAAARQLADRHDTIDLLINNAGVSGSARATTEDGFERHLGTNHLGHFALTGLLLHRLLAAPAARIVTVSSSTHRTPGADQFDDLRWDVGYRPFAAYGRSKLANLLFTYALHRKLAGTGAMAVAAHPGGSATDLMRDTPPPLRALAALALQSPAMGALPTLRAATDPAVLGGQFYGPSGRGQVRGHPQLVTSSDRSYDLELQQRLWAASEELTGVRYHLTTPAETARRFVTALQHGDADRLRAMIAPDVVARFPTASGIFPARLDGAGPLLAHLERAMSTFDTLSYEIHTLVGDARTAVAEFGGRGTIQGRDDYTNAYVMIFTTGPDGRIRELVEYYNPIATATYFGLAEVTVPSR